MSESAYSIHVRLLIVTQKVDRADPILGFFHRWIEEFAKHYEQVIVVGQSTGEFSFPQNVRVLSLGKEEGRSRLMQVFRYRWLLWKLRHEYAAILIHMTPIWVVIAWPVRVFFRKPIYLWYEARGGGWPLNIALKIVRKVFSASTQGMPVATEKSVVTGHGIDTETFHRSSVQRDPYLLLTVSRITRAKRLQVILDTFEALPHEFRLLIAGHAITDDDHRLQKELAIDLLAKGIVPRVEIKAISPGEIVSAYHRAAVFLHASETSLDKALLEAMACGCLIVSCAQAAHAVLPPACLASPAEMHERVHTLLGLPETEKEALRHQLRETVVQEHSLQRLIRRLVEEMR